MAVNAFLTFLDGKAEGESIQKGKEKWIEIQGWDWEIEAETSWTKAGGASVGKPNPGEMNWEHYFDTSSTVIMGYICTGKAFPKVELQMMKTTGSATPQTYYTMVMEGAFITKGTNSGTEEGNVAFSRRTSRAPVRFRTCGRSIVLSGWSTFQDLGWLLWRSLTTFATSIYGCSTLRPAIPSANFGGRVRLELAELRPLRDRLKSTLSGSCIGPGADTG